MDAKNAGLEPQADCAEKAPKTVQPQMAEPGDNIAAIQAAGLGLAQKFHLPRIVTATGLGKIRRAPEIMMAKIMFSRDFVAFDP